MISISIKIFQNEETKRIRRSEAIEQRILIVKVGDLCSVCEGIWFEIEN